MEFLDLLFIISSKTVVVSLACVGAIFVTLAPFARKAQERNKSISGQNEPPRPQIKIENLLTKVGYAVMSISVFLFIIAGFVSDLV